MIHTTTHDPHDTTNLIDEPATASPAESKGDGMDWDWKKFVGKERIVYRPYLRDMVYNDMAELYDSIHIFLQEIQREEQRLRGACLSWFTRGLAVIRYKVAHQAAQKLPDPSSPVASPSMKSLNPAGPSSFIRDGGAMSPTGVQGMPSKGLVGHAIGRARAQTPNTQLPRPTSRLLPRPKIQKRSDMGTIQLQGCGVDSSSYKVTGSARPVTWRTQRPVSSTATGHYMHTTTPSSRLPHFVNLANYSRAMEGFVPPWHGATSSKDVVDTGVLRATRSPRHVPFLRMMRPLQRAVSAVPREKVEPKDTEREKQRIHLRAHSPFKEKHTPEAQDALRDIQRPMAPPAVEEEPNSAYFYSSNILQGPALWRSQPKLRVFRPILP